MAVRRAVEGDLAAIVRMEAEAFGASHWPAAEYEAMLRRRVVFSRRREVFVLEREEVLAGVAVVSVLRLGGEAEAEVENVMVDERFRRQGIGRMLCEACVAEARSYDAEVMRLEVRASNGGAIALYAGMGFAEAGRRRGYYRDPVEDAVLMELVLVDRSQDSQE